MTKGCLFLFSLVVSISFFAQEHEQVESLIDSLVRKHGVKEIRIDLQSINLVSDTHIQLETKYFDSRGNIIESISPGSRGRFERRIYRYDENNRRTLFREYDKQDTTLFHAETKWIYLDSLHYKREDYFEGKMTSYIDYSIRSAIDTLWIIENEYNLEYDYHDLKVSRYRTIGDSLDISEFIKYNRSGQMDDIDTYFKLKRDVDTGYLILEGQYNIKSEEWDVFYEDREMMRDYYNNPEKYLQMQLDGKFEFEYEEDPFTYEVYNYKGQLLQDGRWIYKTTFEYNDRGQLTKSTRWGDNEREQYGGIIRTGYTDYEYNENGFPIKITNQLLNRDITRVYTYTYTF